MALGLGQVGTTIVGMYDGQLSCSSIHYWNEGGSQLGMQSSDTKISENTEYQLSKGSISGEKRLPFIAACSSAYDPFQYSSKLATKYKLMMSQL